MACTSCQVVILPHFEEVKVPVSNSAVFPKKCPLEEDFGGFGGGKGFNIFLILLDKDDT